MYSSERVGRGMASAVLSRGTSCLRRGRRSRGDETIEHIVQCRSAGSGTRMERDIDGDKNIKSVKASRLAGSSIATSQKENRWSCRHINWQTCND